VCYKLYIGKITCKSIESISISHPMNLRLTYMITLESGGMSHSKKIAYSISKIPIHQNERKQTGPKCFCIRVDCGLINRNHGSLL
jgi:hypothetical protein